MPKQIELAHCRGTGAGEFFRRSLEEALQNRTAWIDVTVEDKSTGPFSCDFVFLRDGKETEILRVNLSLSGFAESTEIWLRFQAPNHRSQHPNTEDLRRWIAQGGSSPLPIKISSANSTVVLSRGDSEVTLFPRPAYAND